MINVSKSLPDIAVLRGGNKNFKKSLSEGGEVLASLTKIGYRPVDVLIEADGNWTTGGRGTDAHSVFTRAHTVVDTTRMRGEDYQRLAKEMGIALIFSQANEMCLDREDMYRILRQKGFAVPDTTVIRASKPIKDSILRDIWSTYHTPIMVRSLVKRDDAPTKLAKVFIDLENTVREYHDKGIDLHILTYKKFPTSSIAVLPRFRGEALYTPVWVETFARAGEMPNESSLSKAYTHAPDFRKEQMKKFVTDVYNSIGLMGPVCIDMIEKDKGYVVVNIDTEPSLLKTGRFMQSLETTGAGLGEYIHERVRDEWGI